MKLTAIVDCRLWYQHHVALTKKIREGEVIKQCIDTI